VTSITKSRKISLWFYHPPQKICEAKNFVLALEHQNSSPI
jgi:hypothetical protein